MPRTPALASGERAPTGSSSHSISFDENATFERLMAQFQAKRTALNNAIAHAEARGDYLHGCQLSREKAQLYPPDRQQLRAMYAEQVAQIAPKEELAPAEAPISPSLSMEIIRRQATHRDSAWRRTRGLASLGHMRPASARASVATPEPSHDVGSGGTPPSSSLDHDVDQPTSRSTTSVNWRAAFARGASPNRKSHDLQQHDVNVVVPQVWEICQAKWEIVEDAKDREDAPRRARQLQVGQRHLRQLGFGKRDVVSRRMDEGDTGRWCVARPPNEPPVTTIWGGISTPKPGEHRRVREASANMANARNPVVLPHRAIVQRPLPNDRPWSAVPRSHTWRHFSAVGALMPDYH